MAFFMGLKKGGLPSSDARKKEKYTEICVTWSFSLWWAQREATFFFKECLVLSCLGSLFFLLLSSTLLLWPLLLIYEAKRRSKMARAAGSSVVSCEARSTASSSVSPCVSA